MLHCDQGRKLWTHIRKEAKLEVTPQTKEKEELPSQPSGLRGLGNVMLFLAVVAGLVAAFKYTHLGYYFQRPVIEQALDQLGLWAPLGFVLIYAIGAVLAIPGTLLTAVGGVVFGPYLGTALVVLGATAGATLAFLTSRFFARDYVVGKFGQNPWFRKLENGINAKGVRFVLFVRLVPVFPFNWLNYACGLTSVSLKDYLVGTFFGIMPASFVFTNAAAKVAGAAAGEGIGLDFYLSLSLLGLLSAVSMMFKGKEDQPGEPEEEKK